jgi:NiFe hydrogenase small subunit HydA
VSNLLWLQGASCGGDTISFLNSEQPSALSAFDMLQLNVLWHPFLSREQGKDVQTILADITSGAVALDLFVLEGAVPNGPDGTGKFFLFCGRPFKEVLLELCGKARSIMAIGTCAAFGGVVTAHDNINEVSGLQFLNDRKGGLLGPDFTTTSGLPVVNVPGCPSHPDWIVETMTALMKGWLTPGDLDAFHRPKVFFSKLAHHGCPRNEYYEFKASATHYSQQGCLFEFLGCKGTLCESDCNERLWLGRTGSCTRGGFPCIACTSPLFPDRQRPYFNTRKVGEVPVTLPLDVPKAWYVGISGLSKLACPERLKKNAVSFKWVK